MRRPYVLALFAFVAGQAALARAAPPQPAPAWVSALPPKTVAPVTVLAHSTPPKIVSSFPAEGQEIAPGALVLHITFDQKMDEDGFSFSAAPGGQAPDCLKTPRLLSDDKTFVLLCTTSRKTAYALAFNAAPQGGFTNIGGTRAVPAKLTFTTSDAVDGPHDLDAALKAAQLTRADVPISRQP
jgi:hypothetical protein